MKSSINIELLGSQITFQKNTLDSIPKGSILISEDKIFNIYTKNLDHLKLIVIKEGEKNKNLTQVDYIINSLLDLDVDRSTEIYAFGGGVLLDIAAFAASIFLRGIKIKLIPTSLLAMVDASVGGKNGVNYYGYKNLVGVIRQPEKVIIDTDFLKTLPKDELINGYAELIKTFLIKDFDLFTKLSEKGIDNIRETELQEFILKSVKIKAEIVRHDEYESGLRKILNFGHTFGHAIEREESLPHGRAVAVGMIIAARFSKNLGLITEDDYLKIKSLLDSFGLPTKEIISEDILEAIKKDKKRNSDKIDFVLLNGIGNAEIKPLSISQIKNLAQ